MRRARTIDKIIRLIGHGLIFFVVEVLERIGPQIDNLRLDTKAEPLATRTSEPPLPVRTGLRFLVFSECFGKYFVRMTRPNSEQIEIR
jgi:hypothetical protein